MWYWVTYGVHNAYFTVLECDDKIFVKLIFKASSNSKLESLQERK